MAMEYKLMIVDDNMSNLIMAQKSLEEEYEVLPVSSGLSALECLSDMPDLPDLVVLDVDMPNVNGFQVISEMKNSNKLKDIPIIFLTAQDDTTTELESYNLGALDYIHKPYTASLLKKRINVQIQLLEQKRKLEDLNALLTEIIQGQKKKNVLVQFTLVDMLFELMKKRNVILSGHAERVEKYMRIFTVTVGASDGYIINEEQARMMCAASKLHDIGKISLKDMYLDKAYENHGDYDKEVERMHTIIGSDAVRKLMPTNEFASDFTNYIYNMCRSHHEKFDGSGYPDCLSGKNIPLEARMLAIVNTYDSLRNDKRKGAVLSHADACVRLVALKGKALDRQLVDIFLKKEKEIEGI